MEAIARLKYLQASPQKVRLVADQIRGMNVEEASALLQLSAKYAAKPLAKLLRSAVANAEDRDPAVDIAELYIREIFVDGGPTLKRLRPQPMGRAFRILKRQSHVTIKLDSRGSAAKAT